MHLFLSDPENEPFLLDELRRSVASGHHFSPGPGRVLSDFPLQAEAPVTLVFARQFLPQIEEQAAPSITAWSERLLAAVLGLPDTQPWCLHIEPHYGTRTAGQRRCGLIRETFRHQLRRKQRALFRLWREESAPFTVAQSLVQLLLTAPDRGYLSVSAAPQPFQFRRLLSPFPKGEISLASDKKAPSRAFAKLLEAEQRLGCRIAAGQTCVDLGAAPGSWSYVALRRGARVIAVDRTPLRADLMGHSRLVFRKGDAFRFEPDEPADWLLCDVIAAPERSVALLLDWIRLGRARRFVVTIKFKGEQNYGVLEQLKHALPAWCDEFFLVRLCANKNEACAFGLVREGQGSA